MLALLTGHSALAQKLETPLETKQTSWTFSASGHARTMVEVYRNIDLGMGEIKDDAWLQQRLQTTLSLSYDEDFEIVTDLSWGNMWWRRTEKGPPDRDDGDVLQLYLQKRVHDDFIIKAGRQTLQYGSGRLLSKREGANQRLAHDAFLVSWQRGEAIRVDTFLASPVETGPGIFDNQSAPDKNFFWGTYAVLASPWNQEASFDLYYIGLNSRDSIFASYGRELRHTLGARYWDETAPWIRNSEFIFQFGKAGERDVLAGAVSLGVGREFSSAVMKPTLMLRADIITGGGKDGTLSTFNPLFQANNYFNEGGFLSPSNLYNINPLLIMKPHANIAVSLGVNFQWRFSANDAVYAPPLQELGAPAPEADTYLGTAFNASISWKIHDKAELTLGYTHHEAGPSLTAVGGGDVDYFQAAFLIEF